MRGIGGTTLVAAALVFLVSAVAFGATVVGAIRVTEAPTSSGAGAQAQDPGASDLEDPSAAIGQGVVRQEEGASARPLPALRYPRIGNDELLAAVNQDLFQPDRTPPLERYLLPSERESVATSSRNDRRRREPDLRVVGTAIAGDRALAMVQPDDSIPFAVLLGESVDGFLMAAIDEESVVFTRDGDEFVYPVVEPQRSGSSNSRDRNARNRNATEEAAQALSERVQQMLRQFQQRGGGAVQARPIQLQFVPGAEVIQRGGQGGRTVTIRPRGGGGSGGGGSRP